MLVRLCQHYKGVVTDKANQRAYHQSGCVTREKHMAHMKQGKGEMLPLYSLHTDLSPGMTHEDGRAVGTVSAQN